MKNSDNKFSVSAIKNGLRSGSFSAVEIAEEYFERIDKKDKDIHAYLRLNKKGALEAAAWVDSRLKAGEALPDLAGVPIALKDVILSEGLPCTASSKILENYLASYDATVVKKLKEQGAVILGKTNTDEFAMGSSTETSAFGPTKNPHDLERVAGGSSGGSAAAVAAGMTVLALGSDTGGSIRQPAGFCGAVGFKPTYGAVSRFGLIAMSSSLDQIGPFASSVEDAETLFDAIKGEDSRDATSFDLPDRMIWQKEDLKRITVGLPKEYLEGGLSKEVGAAMEKAIRNFEDLGVIFKEISLPHTRYALSCYYIIMPAEASTNLSRYDGIRYGRPEGAKNLLEIYEKTKGEGFGEEVKRRILLGTFVLSSGYYDAYYAKAQRVRRLIRQDFEKAFDKDTNGVDAVLAPVSPSTAFKIGEKTQSPMEMYLSDVFTIPANLAGIPALAVPVKDHEGDLPVGFQLMAKWGDDKNLFALGKSYEEA
ncbi:MAG: Asp-tRNA(Asn)/Glu-tRNA(Gln) amidotransferase subunit GatA [Patescibacteria group bacterium]|nr:Asp-tRNA(Asn)/Glu-tRNA(Gln) amidotransferase subunit GatA [Patescibacteria group bacterium]MCL5262045.1 Asp-tRNA(Asn)/Glu-tRNA(Gln) amidotransferase subunit GatA [Patescibacteria group bacterium]